MTQASNLTINCNYISLTLRDGLQLTVFYECHLVYVNVADASLLRTRIVRPRELEALSPIPVVLFDLLVLVPLPTMLKYFFLLSVLHLLLVYLGILFVSVQQ